MTPAAYAAIGCSKNFNSHPRKEDDGMEGITANDLIISTHILARRMTATPTLPRTQFYFNSHPRKEDDIYLLLLSLFFLHFNSHPHEEDDYD